MAALPYMQLYVADYLADTPHLTTEEHGAYLLLLFSYWQTGKPLRVDRLASAARMNNERWTDVKRTLKEFFKEIDGVWIHPRVEKDLEKVAAKSGKNSEAGKASAVARALAKQQLERAAAGDDLTDAERSLQRSLAFRSTIEDTDTDIDKETEDQKHLSPDKPDDESPPSLKKPKAAIPYDKILKKYNEICGHSFKGAATLTDARKKNITKCWDRKVEGKPVFQSGKFWHEYFTWCLRDPHWHGEVGKTWKASLEFVTRHDIVDRLIDEMILEGVFEDGAA